MLNHVSLFKVFNQNRFFLKSLLALDAVQAMWSFRQTMPEKVVSVNSLSTENPFY